MTNTDRLAQALRERISDLIESDDYGVEGSTFQRCPECSGESGAGILNKGITHEPDCSIGLDLALLAEHDALASLAPAAVEGNKLSCGHHVSLAINSTESGQFLYCDLCDERSARRDAERNGT